MAAADLELQSFIYNQVDDGRVFIADMAYAYLGDEKHEFYIWAWQGPDPSELVDQFKRDIEAWIKAAGPKATIVVRRWPETEPQFEGGYQLTARLLVVNRFYHSVLPPFIPKPEGGVTPFFGGTDES